MAQAFTPTTSCYTRTHAPTLTRLGDQHGDLAQRGLASEVRLLVLAAHDIHGLAGQRDAVVRRCDVCLEGAGVTLVRVQSLGKGAAETQGIRREGTSQRENRGGKGNGMLACIRNSVRKIV